MSRVPWEHGAHRPEHPHERAGVGLRTLRLSQPYADRRACGGRILGASHGDADVQGRLCRMARDAANHERQQMEPGEVRRHAGLRGRAGNLRGRGGKVSGRYFTNTRAFVGQDLNDLARDRTYQPNEYWIVWPDG